MFTRRTFAAAVAASPLAACAGRGDYARAVAATWRLVPAGGGFPARALIHAATLAASGHNTQPWRFLVDGTRIRIAPDLSRRTPVVDPDDHHLFASLGCAAETMVQAAPAYGWTGEVLSAGAREGVTLAFAPGSSAPGPMARAIPRRASTRSDYDGRPTPPDQLRGLAAAAGSAVDLELITDRRRLAQATDFIVRSNAAQVDDPGFRAELKAWIRFSEAEALASRDGLFAASTGNPTAPRLVGGPLFDLAFTTKGETDKIVRQMRGSSGLAVFVARSNDAPGWVEAGRAFTRFALFATTLGLKTAFLNQPVEDVATRAAFARWLGAAGRRPNLVLRFGRGPDMPRSLRRAAAPMRGASGA